MAVVAIERLWDQETSAKGYPKEVIAQVLAMAELGYSAKDIAREFNNRPTADTIAKWVQQARLMGIRLPESELAAAQRLIAQAARQRFQQMQHRFGSWSFLVVEELFTATEMAAKILRRELEKFASRAPSEKADKDSLAVIRQMTGTIDYLVKDVSLLAGRPTERQAQSISVGEPEDVSVPEIPPEELAKRLRQVADSIEQRSREVAVA